MRGFTPRDGDMRHAIVRLAADGIWLADLATMALPDRQQLRVDLLEMTRRPS
ncbi:hypothetical protein [Mesorhizobium sp.]|uniref:hypothetical protein n=1 Tax=Mesorhizobium sp. TaxID=1871066 RepID=UPI00338EF4C7